MPLPRTQYPVPVATIKVASPALNADPFPVRDTPEPFVVVFFIVEYPTRQEAIFGSVADPQ